MEIKRGATLKTATTATEPQTASVEEHVAFLRKVVADKNLTQQFINDPDATAKQAGIKLDPAIVKEVTEAVGRDVTFTDPIRTDLKLAQIDSLRKEVSAGREAFFFSAAEAVYNFVTSVANIYSYGKQAKVADVSRLSGTRLKK